MTAASLQETIARYGRRLRGSALGLGLLSFIHLLNDTPAGILPVVLLYQRDTLGLSLAEVGFVAGVYNFTLALAQPLFGIVADRIGLRPVSLGGLLVAIIMVGTWGYAPSFVLLFVAAALAALGSAAFHPATFAGVGRLGGRHRSFYLSIFMAGGTLGHTLGPLLAGELFARNGVKSTAVISVILVVLALGPALTVPLGGRRSQKGAGSENAERSPRTVVATGAVMPAVAVLLLIIAARTAIHWGMMTYLPQQMVATGYAASEAARWLSVFLLLLSAGMLIGGATADRFGARRVIFVALALLGPVLFLIAHPLTTTITPFIALAGLLTGLPTSILVGMGQSLLPQGAGFASGLVVGTGFVGGATGVAVTGLVADKWGLATALLTFAALAVVATAAALVLGLVVTSVRDSRQDEGRV